MDEVIRNKALTKMAKVLSGEGALVFFHLIDNFPDRIAMLDEVAWMIADKGAYLKLGMDSKKYYEIINGLIGMKYLDELIQGSTHLYKINFEATEQFFQDDECIQFEVIDDEV